MLSPRVYAQTELVAPSRYINPTCGGIKGSNMWLKCLSDYFRAQPYYPSI